ncbi:hypothetical protein LCGC14_2997500, partial [marine sediment metagenome]
MSALSLYPHQVGGRKRLRRQKRLILGDDMGMGKTPQAITASMPPVLIICPLGARDHWMTLFRQWQPKAKPTTSVVDVQNGEANVLVVLWGELEVGRDFSPGKPPKKPGIKRLLDVEWRTIVADEAHLAKNRKAQRTIGLRLLSRLETSERVFLLTGTPIPNGRATELWSLLNILDPKRFSSYWRYVEEEVLREPVHGAPPFVFKELELRRPEHFRRNVVDKYILRREKDDPEFRDQYPEKMPPTVYKIDLEGKQLKAYKEMADEMLTLVGDELLLAQNALSQFSRLRQLALSLGIIDPKLADESAKIKVLDEIVEGHPQPLV